MLVFVIMPFNEEFDHIYAHIIKPAFEGEGFEIKRADEFNNQQNILKDIVRGIGLADLIITEVSEVNANVFYELGIAHGLEKPTILVTQNVDDLPFDLRSYRVVPYSNKFYQVDNLKTELINLAQGFKQGNIEFGNPVSDYLPKNASLNPTLGENQSQSKSLTSDSEDEEDQGFWDLVDSAVNALNNMQDDVHEIASLINTLTEKVNSSTQRLNSASSTGASKNSYVIHEIMKTIAQDMMSFAVGLNDRLPNFRRRWDDMRKAYSGLFARTAILDEEDKEATINFRASLNSMNDTVASTLTKVILMRDTISKLHEVSRGISKDITTAGRKSKQQLDELIDILSIGQAYLLRIINLCDEKLSDYETPDRRTAN